MLIVSASQIPTNEDCLLQREYLASFYCHLLVAQGTVCKKERNSFKFSRRKVAEHLTYTTVQLRGVIIRIPYPTGLDSKVDPFDLYCFPCVTID